ncbi:MAG: nucleotide sugar dehydrogenase [Microthrixaceae bacterium]
MSAPETGEVQRATTAPATGLKVRFPADVAVVGLGYVGLPTASALAGGGSDGHGLGDTGRDVVGVDICPERLQAIRLGELDLLDGERAGVQRALFDGRLVLTGDVAAVAEAEAVIVCVPTPVDGHLTPDLAAITAACDAVVRHARVGQTLILTSTSYVGSTRDLLVGPLAARGREAGRDVHVAFSPERIDPGNAEHPQDTVPRVVGGATPACAAAAERIIGSVAPSVCVVDDLETAELTKLFENSFRAVNIALANELASVCSPFGIDVNSVLGAAATKPFGFMRFNPGPGVGGHCIPCDPHYLLWQLRRSRAQAPVIEQAMRSIVERPLQVADVVRSELHRMGVPADRAQVHVLGVAYKPGVEDARESPALDILAELLADGVDVSYDDPHVPALTLRSSEVIKAAPTPLGEPDVVLMHTWHPEYNELDLTQVGLLVDASYRAPIRNGVVRP